MGRKNARVYDEAHRLVTTVTNNETGEVVREYSEGPYATLAAAKGRLPWARRDHEYSVSRGRITVKVEVQSVEDPKWVTVLDEDMSNK